MRERESVTDSMAMNLSKFREIVKDREAWRTEVHGVPKSQTLLNNDSFYLQSTLHEATNIYAPLNNMHVDILAAWSCSSNPLALSVEGTI